MAQIENQSVDVGANDIDYKKALGADDGGLVDTAVDAVKGVVGKLTDKLDPLTEQYAGLFKTGLRTPVMRKPSDYGMDFESMVPVHGRRAARGVVHSRQLRPAADHQSPDDLQPLRLSWAPA